MYTFTVCGCGNPWNHTSKDMLPAATPAQESQREANYGGPAKPEFCSEPKEYTSNLPGPKGWNKV